MKRNKASLALLDMYNGEPNQGMRAIKELLDEYGENIHYEVFDVRAKHEIPDLSFDMYISTGGPGSPLSGDGVWDVAWKSLVDDIWNHNDSVSSPEEKKYVFFICHSFQMACHHFELGKLTQRQVPSFGIYPCHKTKAGMTDRLLRDLEDPYWVVDIRDWQLVQPRLKVFEEHGAKILSIEKIRTHVEYERAIMAVRFSDEMAGTQYHPEADPYGMRIHFAKEENKQKVLTNYSIRKYNSMMKHLEDPERIKHTHNTVIPAFIDNALDKLKGKFAETV
jgi:GMP synthase-like glutamine amidotransferase